MVAAHVTPAPTTIAGLSWWTTTSIQPTSTTWSGDVHALRPAGSGRYHSWRLEFGARPMCYDTESDRRNSRVVIDACIPFRRKKTFPKSPRSSKALDDRLRAKWARTCEGILVPDSHRNHGSLEANHEGSRTTGCPVYRALGPGLRSAWICHQVTRPSSSALYSLTRLRCGVTLDLSLTRQQACRSFPACPSS